MGVLQMAELVVAKEDLKRQRMETEEWKERWKHQNLKLHILMDMWAMREIEISSVDNSPCTKATAITISNKNDNNNGTSKRQNARKTERRGRHLVGDAR